jgi:hypothetical protein
MSHFYFDESIHERGGLIAGAYVYGPDADAEVLAAVRRVGLRAGADEFKSSARMSHSPEQVALRAELQKILAAYRVAVLVTSVNARSSLGVDALRALDQFSRANDLAGRTTLTAFLDQGLFDSPRQAAELSKAIGLHQYCDVRSEQDSRVVGGLQLADLVAHTAGVMLLQILGLMRKQVKAGPDSGYDPAMELDLGFELWTGLRYRFFHAGPVAGQDEMYQGVLMEIGPNGLYISDVCPPELRTAAQHRFGQCYLGCIH